MTQYKKKLAEHATADPNKYETNLYVIYDEVTEKQGPTFEAANHKHALRQSKPILNTEPLDYKLYHVGHRLLNDIGIQAVIPTEIPHMDIEDKRDQIEKLQGELQEAADQVKPTAIKG